MSDSADSSTGTVPPRSAAVSATAAIWGVTALLLGLPYMMLAASLDELFGYGWPGPWLNDMAALNGGEELLGLQVGAFLSVVVLLGGSVAVAVHARATKTGPVLSVLSVLVGLVVLVGLGLLLYPVLTTPSGELWPN